MLRPVAVIASAILLTRPQMPRAEADRYARVLQQEAVRHDFDPFTGVAIVHFESAWLPGVVSPDGEDYGLAQIRARFLSGCQHDEDPVHAPSDACRAAKATLFSGEVNLRRMAMLITANRELCRDKLGSAWFPQWLAGYQGSNRPSRDVWCSPTDKTMRVIAYQKELAARFGPKPAPRPASPPAAAAPVLRETPPAPALRETPVAGRTPAAGGAALEIVAARAEDGAVRKRASSQPR